MSSTEYDRIPYPSNPYPQTHPDHLGVLGALFGLDTAPASRARVLELGCGAGGNLLPLAAAYPGATFVGLDLASTAIAEAQSAADAIGLRNVDLRACSLLDVDRSWGEFDYILCHGLLSWVPEPVRQGIVRILTENLAPHGLGFVSYNALPGWRIRGVCREIMLFHGRDYPDPREKAGQARAMLSFLAKVTPEDGEWGRLLRGEEKRLSKLPDDYILHDNLAPENTPFWFHEFLDRVEPAGLQYLGDAAFDTMVLSNFSPEVADALSGVQDLRRLEQYLDFVRNRAFRQSIVCREGIALDRALKWPQLLPFGVTSRLRPRDPDLDPAEAGESTFETRDGLEIATSTPLVKAALLELHAARPVPLPFPEVVRRAVARLPGLSPEQREAAPEIVGQNLLTCFAKDLVHPRRDLPPIAEALDERPRAWPWARYQARGTSPYVTNLRHEGVDVDRFDRHVLRLLDGTRTPEEIAGILEGQVRSGELPARSEAGPFESEEELRSEIRRSLGISLELFLRSAVLEGPR